MGGVAVPWVVLKWGGGLITDKTRRNTADEEAVRRMARCAAETAAECRLVVVHGAGSFGHIKAREARLAEGVVSGMEEQQREAVGVVRRDMLELNRLVMRALSDAGVDAEAFPPHTWARGTGPQFVGELPIAKNGAVTVTFGDVVDCPGSREFGILSGDDVVVRYATELPDVRVAAFAIGGVDGLLRAPPHKATRDDLLEIWSPNDGDDGFEHQAEIDVTGGIGYKAMSGAKAAAAGVRVMLVNGEHAERVVRACAGLDVRGTQVVPGTG